MNIHNDFENEFCDLSQSQLKQVSEEIKSKEEKKSIDLGNDDGKIIRIAMFSPVSLNIQGDKPQIFNVCKLRRVIIHFHGGGFICMSHSTHQLYLR